MRLAAKVIIVLVTLIVYGTCAPTSTTYNFPTAAVAADSEECSNVGNNILKAGGNAVDAAIATTLCLGVVQPFASGIGGGGVALIYMASTQKVDVFDFRETAPAAASMDMFATDPEASRTGGKAIAIPGEIAGLWKLWTEYGQASWASLVTPNIQLATSSIVNPELAATLIDQKEYILTFPGLRSVFAPKGTLLKAGDTLLQPALAATLTKIRDDPLSFYTGQIAQDLVTDINAAGGIVTLADFAHYYSNGVIHRKPVSTYYQGFKVYGAPPPFTGGLCMALALNLIEPYNFPMMTNQSSLAQHYLIEAWKWAYSDRMAIGDPAFVNQTHVIDAMLSKDHAALLRQKFSSTTTYPPAHYVDLVNPVEQTIFDSGTTHLSVVDRYGNVVGLTSTINLSFGSKILSPLTGIVLNDQMDDFSSPNQTNFFGQPPSVANYIAPNKKPISSMTPTLVMNNNTPMLTIGGSGGTKIITATMQSLLGVMWGEDIGTAIGGPRCHNQNTGDTSAEAAYPASFVSFLESTDHLIKQTNDTVLGVVQGIYISDNNGLFAASDWRKQGVPAGY